MKFLHTITSLENDVLVHIDKIKFVFSTYKDNWEIHIVHEDGKHSWVECFPDEKSMKKRFQIIRELLEKV